METQINQPQYDTMEPVARITDQSFEIKRPTMSIECPFCDAFMSVPICDVPKKTVCPCGSYLTIPVVTVEVRIHKLPDDWEY